MTRLLLLIAYVALLAGCSASYIVNPVIDKDAPDPSVIRIGKTYYAAATSGNNESSYPRFKSNDLKTWTPIGYVFDKWPEWAAGALPCTLCSITAPSGYCLPSISMRFSWFGC